MPGRETGRQRERERETERQSACEREGERGGEVGEGGEREGGGQGGGWPFRVLGIRVRGEGTTSIFGCKTLAVGLCLVSQVGPRGLGVFLWAWYPCRLDV